MARKKTPPVRLTLKSQISARLKELRQELFGEHGGPELARRLNLPARTWYNYETGVTVPAEILLAFIDQTDANPAWLLSGIGPKFQGSSPAKDLDTMTSAELIRRGLEKLLETAGHDEPFAPDAYCGTPQEELVSLDLIPISALTAGPDTVRPVEGRVQTQRRWIPRLSETVAVRIDDASMSPLLPLGSVVAVDLSASDPDRLQGKIVAAVLDGEPVIRCLEVSGRHLLFKTSLPNRDTPVVPVPWEFDQPTPIVGQVVWSWCQFLLDHTMPAGQG